MASTCLNCKKRLGCGCQKAVALDGKSVCKSCKAGYELKLKTNLKKFVNMVILNLMVLSKVIRLHMVIPM